MSPGRGAGAGLPDAALWVPSACTLVPGVSGTRAAVRGVRENGPSGPDGQKRLRVDSRSLRSAVVRQLQLFLAQNQHVGL